MSAQLEHQTLEEYTFDGVTMCGSIFPREILEKIKKGEYALDPSDVMVISYPKSGSAWLQEITWLLINDVDIETARNTVQEERVVFLELSDGETPAEIGYLETRPPPRIVKSHLDCHLLGPAIRKAKAKTIVGVRNAKDALISYYHFYRMNVNLGSFKGTFSQFFELFKQKRIAHGDWFDMNLSYWEARHDIDLLFVRYEDLHRDLPGNIRRVAAFLGKDLSDEQVSAIAEHVSFKSMSTNVNLNKSTVTGMVHGVSPYMRRGTVGDWKNYFSVEESAYIDRLYEEKIKGTELDSVFTL